MKILAICQAMDISYRDLGITPIWWQILKALNELGHEVVAIPYFGREIESLWWRSYKNPCAIESSLYRRIEDSSIKLPIYQNEMDFRQKHGKFTALLTKHFVAPKWKKYLVKILDREKNIEVVIVFCVPLNQFKGVPTFIGQHFDVPVVFYDGDTPASLPTYGGLSHSFYVGADLTEYDAFIITSKGSVSELQKMGAQRVYAIAEGADPSVFSPMRIKQDIDVFFWGVGSKFRENWMMRMLTYPSKVLSNVKFAIGGKAFDIDLGYVRNLGMVPYRTFSCRSKINLSIVRKPLAEVYASSTSRLFELASMKCCIVSSPALGINGWFEVGKEVFVAENEKEAIELYKWLLSSDDVRLKAGKMARERVLKEHTYLHRAKELTKFLEEIK